MLKLLIVSFIIGLNSPGDSLNVRSVQMNIGTRGVGLESNIWANGNWAGRVGIHTFFYSKPLRIKAEEGSFIEVNPALRSLSPYLLLDYYPFQSRLFRVTGGADFALIQNYSAEMFTQTTLKLGGIEMEPEDVGRVVPSIRWNRFKPYLGVGLGRSVMKKRIGLGLDIGCYYMGKPSLGLVYEGFLETTTIDQEIAEVESRMSGYRYYPYVSFQIRYSLK